MLSPARTDLGARRVHVNSSWTFRTAGTHAYFWIVFDSVTASGFLDGRFKDGDPLLHKALCSQRYRKSLPPAEAMRVPQGPITTGRPAHAPVSDSFRRTARSCRFRATLTAFLRVKPNFLRRLDASFAEMKACKRYRKAVTCYVC